ncbi:MAG: hypothetical protein R3F13_09870 [Prosthecobacter sp.]
MALPRTLGTLGYDSFQTGKFWEGIFPIIETAKGMTVFEPAPHLNYGGVTRTLADGSKAAHGNGDHGLAIGRETMQPIADFLDRRDERSRFSSGTLPTCRISLTIHRRSILICIESAVRRRIASPTSPR